MSWPKLLVIIAIVLFSTIGVTAIFKKSKAQSSGKLMAAQPVELDKTQEASLIPKSLPKKEVKKIAKTPPSPKKPIKPKEVQSEIAVANSPATPVSIANPAPLPDADRIEELFRTEGKKLPIVETITYKSRVDWQKGRPAWLYDYAKHYNTSRHFIARSLSGEPDYLMQEVSEGDRFNVFKANKNFEFYLLVDLSRCKIWFYYDDLDTQERVLLKTYNVAIGRVDGSRSSGFLTPLGKYSLGNKVAIYKTGIKGFHHGDHIEMISVFGTRWIPFDKEIKGCTSPAKGYGLHGVPHVKNAKGEWIEDLASIGKYDSDGCIRMASKDIEELYAIVLTKPTTVHLVKDFYEVK